MMLWNRRASRGVRGSSSMGPEAPGAPKSVVADPGSRATTSKELFGTLLPTAAA
jgi:hypothetical protein